MPTPEKTLDQQVVLYDAPGETGVIYETAYTETQMQAARLRCQNAHGAKSNPRVIPAARRMRGEKR